MRGSDSRFRNGWHGDAVLARLSELDAEEVRRRRLLAAACAGALALHAVVALVVPRPSTRTTLPELLRAPLVLAPTPRFQPPPPDPAPPAPPTRRVPIPDPTPEALEPIVALAPAAPVLDVPLDLGTAAIPSPPPLAEPVVYEVGRDVSAPVKLYAPEPVYPRAALLARRAGTVVVEATIDREGRVTALRALTSRGLGLEEAALAAVAEWRFRPALRRGEPVPVLFRLTVNFSLVR
jgi:protein TonB